MVKRLLRRPAARAYAFAQRAHHDLRYEGFRRRYDLDATFWFNGLYCDLYGEGAITAGPDSYIGNHTTIQAVAGLAVTIGRGVAISHGVRIYTESRDPSYDVRLQRRVRGDVTIGDYAWIGAGAFINPGVTIGEHAVVGANSVVTRGVEPWTIVGGVPARLIREKTPA